MARLSAPGRLIGVSGPALVLVFWVGLGGLFAAQPIGASSDPAASGLRIYSALDRHGRPVTVLTNLDDEGNRLISAFEEEAAPAAARPAEPCRAPSAAEVDRRAVSSEPSAASDGAQAPAVVVNVYNELPGPPVATAPVVPVVAYGGLVGPFHYPAQLPFLGYGTGLDFPVFFRGMGLGPAAPPGHPRGGHPDAERPAHGRP